MSVEIAILGDLHGEFDAAVDGPLLARFPLRACTGDLVPNRGRDRFDVAMRIARELRECEVHVVLGNHDGPTGLTGRSFPKSYHALVDALGPLHLSHSLLERPDLDLALVGGRPLSFGSGDKPHPVPAREDWTFERWGEEIAGLIAAARAPRVVVVAHDGPTGLGSRRESIYGCDFKPEQGDWGDPDLRLALDAARAARRPLAAVIAGHMHHGLRGGGVRRRAVREDGLLHVNVAIMPRVRPDGARALTVLRLDESGARARIEWHHPAGAVEVEELEAEAALPAG